MKKLIDTLLRDATPRPKSLIVTLLGDAIKPRGGRLWLGTLISICEPMGINERAVRTYVQRLSQDGWLHAERDGRRSRYSLTPEGRARIEQASPRMYSPPIDNWDGRWTVALVQPNSLQSDKRAKLRKYLEWEGYSMAASGLFLHPLGNAQNLKNILEELDIADQIFVFAAEASDIPGIRPLRDGVTDFWDLESAYAHYNDFIARFSPWRKQLEASVNLTNEEQALTRWLTIHAFRRASLHAPRLPAALFPRDWPGLEAYELCKAIYQHSWQAAEAWLDGKYFDGGEPEISRQALLKERFGGLVDENSGADASRENVPA